jgi:uncharacterized RDD family membrane protein YckC
LSTLGQPHPEPAWKLEVARRLAAHKNRKGAPAPETSAQSQNYGGSLAAQAAARVAARYAKAPSYSDMQAEEARMAVRAAEIATKVALEAQAAAHSAIAELHAASEPQRGPAVVESIVRAPRVRPAEEGTIAAPECAAAIEPAQPEAIFDSAPAIEPEPETLPAAASILAAESIPAAPQPEPVITHQVVDGRDYGLRWEPDTPVRVLQPRATPAPEPFELETEDWWTPAQVSATLRNEPIAIEAQPAAAHLIEFPRELVATRKMRPRLAEPIQSATAERQLSIFEVDPGAISTEPAAADVAAPGWSDPNWSDPNWSAQDWAAPSPSPAQWSRPGWSGMELGEHPASAILTEPEPAPARQSIFLAPFGYRLMATVVDACLILAGFFAAATTVAARMQQPLAPHTAEAFVVAGLAIAGFVYTAFFFALGVSTPGMRYAGIALSTFEDEAPTRAQLRKRLGAMALSLLPVGLGLAWSVFDEDHLTWHDRISQTYLRKR